MTAQGIICASNTIAINPLCRSEVDLKKKPFQNE
jgi:hypothetical protein